jgi:hypothetical protein
LKSCHGSRTLVNGHMRSIALHVVRKPENGHDILKLNYLQMRESGYINHSVTVMLADTKAKTVTNKLPQLTVLLAGFISCLGTKKLSCYNYFGFCLAQFGQDNSLGAESIFNQGREKNFKILTTSLLQAL